MTTLTTTEILERLDEIIDELRNQHDCTLHPTQFLLGRIWQAHDIRRRIKEAEELEAKLRRNKRGM